MSIEAYRTRPVDSVARPVSVVDYGGRSVIQPYAEELILEGIDGLGIVHRRLDAIDRYSAPVRTAFLERNSVVSDSLKLNQAALIAGLTLQEVERMLETGQFSESEFIRRYHEVTAQFSNSDIARGLEHGPGDPRIALDLWAETMEVELISPETISEMRATAEKDSSLSDAFTPAVLKKLPQGLQRILEESGTLSTIRLYIIPAYRRRFGYRGW